MAADFETESALTALLYAKVALAAIAACIYAYYRLHWEKSKKHLDLQYFFAKWRVSKYAVPFGYAAILFAIGFGLELIGSRIGFSAGLSMLFSGIFEMAALVLMLLAFLEIAIQDVPYLQDAASRKREAHREKSGKTIARRAAKRARRKRKR